MRVNGRASNDTEGSGLEGTIMTSFEFAGSGRPGSPRRRCAVEGCESEDVSLELGGGHGCHAPIRGSLGFRWWWLKLDLYSDHRAGRKEGHGEL